MPKTLPHFWFCHAACDHQRLHSDPAVLSFALTPEGPGELAVYGVTHWDKAKFDGAPMLPFTMLHEAHPVTADSVRALAGAVAQRFPDLTVYETERPFLGNSWLKERPGVAQASFKPAKLTPHTEPEMGM